MPPWYLGDYEPKKSINNFEAAKEVSIATEIPMIETKRFERIDITVECKSYMKHEYVPG